MPWVDVSDADPGRVDLLVRAAIHKCWHALPPDQQAVDTVEQVFRRLVDRAFRDLREDADQFSAVAAPPSSAAEAASSASLDFGSR